MTEEESIKEEVKQSKSSNTLPIVIIAIIGIVVLLAVFNWFSTGMLVSTGTVPSTVVPTTAKQCRDVQVPYESQEEYMKTEYYTETVPYTDKECENKPLVYSITDFMFGSSICNQQLEECNKYVIGICTQKTTYCVDRTVTCSLKLNNLDDERGSWAINFNFFKVGSSSIVATNPVSRWLYPHTSDTLVGTGRITTKELKDTSYTCSYSISNEATKQVCRDVTKYKDVQKERQVTAYRPVTKYRTENQCG